MTRPSRRWTQKEIEYLANNWGIATTEAVCRRLKRSHNAVQIRAVQLGVNRKSNVLNASTVAEQMGVNMQTVRRWINLGLLRARRSHNGQDGKKWWQVRYEDLERFVREQVEIYDPK